MRKKYIAGNWKMNMSLQDGVHLAEYIIEHVQDISSTVMIAPAFTLLDAIGKVVQGTQVLLGSQNCSHKISGAFTGDVSVSMLKDVGVSVVIIGHSERRMVFNENNTIINEKVLITLEHGLEVILCVGETLEERDVGAVDTVINTQISAGLQSVAPHDMNAVTIAYEPVWAIGTGRTASPEIANDVHKKIRDRISEMYSTDVAESLLIQYGGSVKSDNAHALLQQDHIDGALVGGASLDGNSFIVIAKA